MKIELEISEDNEGTESPWWMLIDPAHIRRCMEGAAESGEVVRNHEDVLGDIAFAVEGPFFSRKEAEDYLASRRYAYSEHAGVWCSSGYHAQQYKAACRKARGKG